MFRAAEGPRLRPGGYETKQVFYTSKDGTKVPMFLVHRKGLKLDGNNPTLLYGYGGFNVVQSPTFSASRLALLEQGFVYASANMRGGGEYGEKWHQAGMKLKKQNVFDDFIAAAEWLIANKYTSSAAAGDPGRIERRPARRRGDEPAARAVPRRHSAGRRHGHAALPQVHDRLELGRRLRLERRRRRVRGAEGVLAAAQHQEGRKYPATLVTTADHDDRVVPAHSFKYAATLQELASHDNPLLIRIETNSAHGASSLDKQLETAADIYSFIMFNMGVTPVVPARRRQRATGSRSTQSAVPLSLPLDIVRLNGIAD